MALDTYENLYQTLRKNPRDAAGQKYFILCRDFRSRSYYGSVDNDAGGITTYSGAAYGYDLIWTLIPCFVALVVVQEMNLRMGIFTGKGLADLIRENFGVKFTFFFIFGIVLRGYWQHGHRICRCRGKFADFWRH